MTRIIDKKLFIIGLGIAVCLWFWPSFTIYFAQDDFWLFLVSQANSLSEFFNLFLPSSEVVWYRPLSQQLFFFTGRILFGWNPFPFHILVISIHLITGLWLFRLLKKLNQSQEVAIVATFIYLLNQIHTVPLSWLAANHFVVGPLFVVLSLYFFLKEKPMFSFASTILGVMTNEVALFMPLFLFPLSFYIRSDTRKKSRFFILLPFILLSFFIVWIRQVAYPTEINDTLYRLEVSGSLSALKFYLLRILGVPLFFANLPFFTKIITSALFAVWIGGLLIGLKVFREIRKQQFSMLIFFTLFLGGLVPFIILPEHLSPYYLSFALVGAAPLFTKLLNALKKFGWQSYYLVLGAYLSLQLIGTYSTYQTHWIFKRAQMAERLIESGDLIHPLGSEEYFSLGGSSAKELFLGPK